ncbi:MAG: MauE/DoxX family redox-associated membrane protein [Chthoniobacterales bacterium]
MTSTGEKTDPYLNPLPDGEEAAKRPVRALPKFVWRTVDLIFGGVFVYAGILKALDPVRFGLDIDNYKILPWFVSVRLGFYLPWLEIFCGIALIFRFLYRGGLSILTVLVLIFIGATVAAKARRLDITCGCFGHASQNWSFSQHMAIDLSILLALVALLFAHRTKAEL